MSTRLPDTSSTARQSAHEKKQCVAAALVTCAAYGCDFCQAASVGSPVTATVAIVRSSS
jgi:hypothetical protein